MGTRGAFGFHYMGVDKITYNHFDSYPEALGMEIVRFCKETSLDDMKRIFKNITLVNEFDKPTPNQQVEYESFMNLRVSRQSPEDLYCLLREVQGGLDAWKNGVRYMIDSKDFLKDSLFCEHAYIINLDIEDLEVYEGFQDEPQKNRYYIKTPNNGYYNCRLIKTIPLSVIRLRDEDYILRCLRGNKV